MSLEAKLCHQCGKEVPPETNWKGVEYDGETGVDEAWCFCSEECCKAWALGGVDSSGG
jgi:YHS domain-containing protein